MAAWDAATMRPPGDRAALAHHSGPGGSRCNRIRANVGASPHQLIRVCAKPAVGRQGLPGPLPDSVASSAGHPSRTDSHSSQSDHFDAEVGMGGASPIRPTSRATCAGNPDTHEYD